MVLSLVVITLVAVSCTKKSDEPTYCWKCTVTPKVVPDPGFTYYIRSSNYCDKTATQIAVMEKDSTYLIYTYADMKWYQTMKCTKQ